MLRVVAASMGPSPALTGFRDYARNDELRGNDELFEFCGNDMTYFIAEACALTPH
jgi:hypothetical protein